VTAAAAIGVLMMLSPGAHGSESPASAWWSRSNTGLVPSTGEPGVSEGQLVVSAASNSEDGWLSASAVVFPLAGPVADATLTLTSVSSIAGSVPPIACALTENFEPASGGPWQDLPAHDCTHAITATPTPDGRLVFGDIGAFATNGVLAALIAPGGPGRLVLSAPTAEALAITAPDSGPSSQGQAVPAPQPPSPGPVVTVAAVSVAGSDGPHQAQPAPRAAAPAAQTVPSASIGRSSDLGARLATAAAVGAFLGGLTAMQRGSGARLRPSRVPWATGEAPH